MLLSSLSLWKDVEMLLLKREITDVLGFLVILLCGTAQGQDLSSHW